MAQEINESPQGPIVAGPGTPPIAAVGTSLVVHEWTESGPSYLHVHRSDDEAWHVLEGSLRFRFADREVDAPAGTTVFVPAGSPHTYRVTAQPSRYLIFLTARLDRLIARLQRLSGPIRAARHACRVRHRAGGVECARRRDPQPPKRRAKQGSRDPHGDLDRAQRSRGHRRQARSIDGRQPRGAVRRAHLRRQPRCGP
jgi:Cupin domain